MNNLTKKHYTRAWTACFVQRQNGGKLALGELREIYERDTHLVCFLPNERDQIREGLCDACIDFLGAVCQVPPANATDDTMLDGIGFRPRTKMAGKPELWTESQTTINIDSGFNEKGGLSDRGAANGGVACALGCFYCSTEKVMERNPQTTILRVLGVNHGDVVIRKLDALETARRQLTWPDGSPRYDRNDHGILETASIVDPLGTKVLMEETVQLVRLVFDLTGWRVRVLTKSNLLAGFAHRFQGDERQRLLLGFSYGIPDDKLARIVERGTALPSIRRTQHRKLLEEGYTMFAMPCPILPGRDYRALAESIAADLQFERMERTWVEVMNDRGGMVNTINAVQKDYPELANQLARFRSSEILWEVEYNRAVFLAFKDVVPAGKLAYLTYVTDATRPWWSQYVGEGAVLL